MAVTEAQGQVVAQGGVAEEAQHRRGAYGALEAVSRVGDQVRERETIVIGTNSMPVEDWKRTYMFSWAGQCMHSMCLTQYLALLLHHECGVSYADFYTGLVEFAKNWERQISAEDILDSYDSVREVITELGADKKNALIQKLANHCKENKWKASQAKNAAAFAKGLSGEMLVSCWNQLTQTQNLPNIQKLHKLIGRAVVEAVNSGRNAS